MFSWSVLFAFITGSGNLYTAVMGLSFAFSALSDLLLGRAVGWVVSTLRVIALLGFLSVFVGFVLEAVGGSGIAIFATVFGLAAAVLALAVKKARDGSRQL